jgi:hypothetical protein
MFFPIATDIFTSYYMLYIYKKGPLVSRQRFSTYNHEMKYLCEANKIAECWHPIICFFHYSSVFWSSRILICFFLFNRGVSFPPRTQMWHLHRVNSYSSRQWNIWAIKSPHVAQWQSMKATVHDLTKPPKKRERKPLNCVNSPDGNVNCSSTRV